MTDDAHPDQPGHPARPVRVARFDLADRAGLGTTEGPATDEPAADAGTALRVARLDGLDPATAGRARVAAFDDLDAPDEGRPLAPVIRLDAVGGRRGSGARRSPGDPDEPVQPRTSESAADGDVPTRTRARGPEPRRSRGSRRSAEAERSRDDRATCENTAPAPDVADCGVDAAVADGGVPPDGPLPRGRRKRARAGRLGPDAPDPEQPLPEADPVAIAREICLRLLTDRARTRQELAQALTRKGVPEEAAEAVLDRFAEVGLVDDPAFAGQWVRSRHTYRGLGKRAIAVELRRKGVADGVAKEALAEVDGESEARRARELVDRKLRSTAVDTPERRATAARRLVGMLARKGYGAGIAYRVVREALAEHGADADELGPDADLDR